MSGFRVDDSGLLMTIQDGGRTGWSYIGVPISGPMDWFAFRAANRLVGNNENCAELEFSALGSVKFTAIGELLIAVTGVGGSIKVNHLPMPFWTAIRLHHGDHLAITDAQGAWCYLAISGGVDVPEVMGSRSTCLMAHFGGLDGRALQSGDILPVGSTDSDWSRLAGVTWNLARTPQYSQTARVGVLPGPHFEWLSTESRQSLFESPFNIDPSSNRMGYRLMGDKLVTRVSNELLSEGVVAGTIQVPKSGLPIILMADHQTVGGYPVIGIVPIADLPIIAQCPPNCGSVSFYPSTNEEAINQLEMLHGWLNEPLEEDEIWSLT